MIARRLARSSLLVALLPLVATALAHAQGIEKPRVPLRTAIKEINTLRAEYADYYNQKNAAAVAGMYSSDAVLLRGDGSTLKGQAEISKAFADESANWKKLTISSDTLRVFGNTAWDVGTLSSQGSGGESSVSHYLVVLRRGIQTWKINSVAVVQEAKVTATK